MNKVCTEQIIIGLLTIGYEQIDNNLLNIARKYVMEEFLIEDKKYPKIYNKYIVLKDNVYKLKDGYSFFEEDNKYQLGNFLTYDCNDLIDCLDNIAFSNEGNIKKRTLKK